MQTKPLLLVVMALTGIAGCADAPPEREVPARPAVAFPAPRALRVAATRVTPLGSSRSSDEHRVSPARQATIETPAGRFIASVEATTVSLESTASRIVLRARSQTSGSLIREHSVKEDAVNLFGLTWAPDGSAVAFCEGLLVSSAGWSGPPQVLYAGPGGPYPGGCANLTWSADGRQLQFVQVEHATDDALANPARIVLELELNGTRH